MSANDYECVVSYNPKLRVSEYEGLFYVEMQRIPPAMISSSMYLWEPIPNFKLYGTKCEAETVMNNLIKLDFKQQVQAKCLDGDILRKIL